jgi:oxygen-independent coproporphyrinogen-3 oxidase
MTLGPEAPSPAHRPITPHWPGATVDRTLIRKYDAPGPRYTSYPTAPNFRELGPSDYERRLESSARLGRQLSLYLHLPFCRTLCFYCGCNVTISHSPERVRAYIGHVRREIAAVAERLSAGGREVVQFHLGGGTPNFVPPDDLRDLVQHFRSVFRFHPGAEIGVEVDPRTMTPEHLDAFAEAGVNRLSAGLQDLDPKVQEAINRVQSAEVTRAVVDGAHRRGIESVNLDLIYGLPHQTPETFAATVDQAVAMAPERFAVFNFAYLPKMLRHQQVIDPASLPSAEEKLTILETAFAKLAGAGYVMIGMDHFARPEDPLSQALLDRSLTRNFQGYSTWGETDLVAFGASGIGFVADAYFQNVKTVAEYQERISSGSLATCRGLELGPEDLLRRDVILQLMCHLHLDMKEVGERHGVDFAERFAAELAALSPLAEDGLVELGEDTIDVTPVGRLLVRNVALVFDEYLTANRQAAFSRTV